jgi:hypothetical protein
MSEAHNALLDGTCRVCANSLNAAHGLSISAFYFARLMVMSPFRVNPMPCAPDAHRHAPVSLDAGAAKIGARHANRGRFHHVLPAVPVGAARAGVHRGAEHLSELRLIASTAALYARAAAM